MVFVVLDILFTIQIRSCLNMEVHVDSAIQQCKFTQFLMFLFHNIENSSKELFVIEQQRFCSTTMWRHRDCPTLCLCGCVLSRSWQEVSERRRGTLEASANAKGLIVYSSSAYIFCRRAVHEMHIWTGFCTLQPNLHFCAYWFLLCFNDTVPRRLLWQAATSSIQIQATNDDPVSVCCVVICFTDIFVTAVNNDWDWWTELSNRAQITSNVSVFVLLVKQQQCSLRLRQYVWQTYHSQTY